MKIKYDDHLLRELGFKPEHSSEDGKMLVYEEGRSSFRFVITIDGWMRAVSMQAEGPEVKDQRAMIPMGFQEIKAVAALLESMEETA